MRNQLCSPPRWLNLNLSFLYPACEHDQFPDERPDPVTIDLDHDFGPELFDLVPSGACELITPCPSHRYGICNKVLLQQGERLITECEEWRKYHRVSTDPHLHVAMFHFIVDFDSDNGRRFSGEWHVDIDDCNADDFLEWCINHMTSDRFVKQPPLMFHRNEETNVTYEVYIGVVR